MTFRTLIAPETLHAHLGREDWRLVDCRFDLADADAGERAWREAHVPGAVYAHLERDLSGPVTSRTGRHPLPDPDRLVQRLGEWGINPASQVVAYDASGGAMAARLWWLLRWLGHDAVAVLDGGWSAWRGAGFPVESALPSPSPTRFERRLSLNESIDTAAVLRAVEGESDWRLVDARAPERFRGEVEPIDPVAGHVPGAVNRPFAENLDARGRFLRPEILRERFATIASGRADRVAHYCGSGVTACHNVLAMEYAGLGGSRLYAGSWSEWIRDPSHPVTREG